MAALQCTLQGKMVAGLPLAVDLMGFDGIEIVMRK